MRSRRFVANWRSPSWRGAVFGGQHEGHEIAAEDKEAPDGIGGRAVDHAGPQMRDGDDDGEKKSPGSKAGLHADFPHRLY